MALKTFVKVSKVTNLSDARYCSGMMVDMLGFDTDPASKDYVSPEKFKDISGWVAGVRSVGECSGMSFDDIQKTILEYGFDTIEVSTLDVLSKLKQSGTRVIFRYTVANQESLTAMPQVLGQAMDTADHIIIDNIAPSLTNEIYQALLPLDRQPVLIRAYDINELTAVETCLDPVFTGLELKGTPEEKPGLKDYGQVMDILEVLEED